MFNIVVRRAIERHQIVLWLANKGINYSWTDQWERKPGREILHIHQGWRINIGLIEEDDMIWLFLKFGEYIV